MNRRRKHTEHAPQQVSCEMYLTVMQQLADGAARNLHPAQPHFRIRKHLKPKLAPKFGERMDVPCPFVAKSEIEAFMNFACVQGIA